MVGDKMKLVDCGQYWVAIRYVGCDGKGYSSVIAICNRKGRNKKEEFNCELWNDLKLINRAIDKSVVV